MLQVWLWIWATASCLVGQSGVGGTCTGVNAVVDTEVTSKPGTGQVATNVETLDHILDRKVYYVLCSCNGLELKKNVTSMFTSDGLI